MKQVGSWLSVLIAVAATVLTIGCQTGQCDICTCTVDSDTERANESQTPARSGPCAVPNLFARMVVEESGGVTDADPQTTHTVEEQEAETPDKTLRDQLRKRARLQRELKIAELKLAKAKIAVELGQLKQGDAQRLADEEFRLAKNRVAIFRDFTRPNRIARAEYDLQWAENNCWETCKELEQLEKMYAEEQFADATKEIVLERARRQLARAERDRELRQQEFKTLTEVTLPMEERELEHAAEQKKRATLQTQRDDEAGIIDRQIAVLQAEAEVERLENELGDLDEETARERAADSADEKD